MMQHNPLFAVAADNWRNEVMTLNKYGSHKTTHRVVKKLILEFGHLRIKEIDKKELQKFIVRLSPNVGVDYIRHLLSVLRGIAEYTDDDWEMPRRLKYPKKHRPKQEVLSFEDARKLFKVSIGQEKVLWMLLAETGCRIGEALALQPDDVQNDTISINKNVYEGVLQPTPKTANSERIVCVSDKLMVELNRLKIPKGFLFRSPTGRPAWPQQLCYSLKESCKLAQVDYKAFHAFRRGNITELLLNIQIPEKIVGMRVGHESQGMTLGLYCHASTGTDKPWVPKIAEYLYGSN